MYQFDLPQVSTKGTVNYTELLVLQDSSPKAIMDNTSEYIARHYDSTLELMKGKSRKLVHFWPRAIAMYAIRYLNGYKISLKAIGTYFGGRDHSSVINAIESVEDMMQTNKDFKDKIQLLISKLK